MLSVIDLKLRVIVTIIDANFVTFFHFCDIFDFSIDFSGGFRFFIRPSKEALPCESEWGKKKEKARE